MKNVAAVITGEQVNAEKPNQYVLGIFDNGRTSITPEALVELILDNENLRHPDYQEMDVMLGITAADLARLARNVELRVIGGSSISEYASKF